MKKNKLGLFIVFEGIDSVGKTTLIKRLKKNLIKEFNLKVGTTFEPGGTKTTKDIRKYLLNTKNKLSPLSELLFFIADRKEHLVKKVLPMLEKNDIVLCDRFYYSTFAYQNKFFWINYDIHKSIGIFKTVPNLVLFLETDWENWKKLNINTNNKPLITRTKYRELNKKYGFTFQFFSGENQNIKYINCDLNRDITYQNVWNSIKELIKEKNVI